MAVITISRQFGAGGLTMGKKLSELLNYSLMDEEILQLVAERARVSQHWALSVEKEAGGKLQKFISSLIPRNVVDRILADQRGYIDEEIYVDLLGQIITQIAEEDNTIIIGRGGQYILKDHPNVFHILLIADLEHRIRFMEKKYHLTRAQATQTVNSEEKRRGNLYRKFNKTDYDRPEHYHLTLNMSLLDFDRAADIVRCMVLGSAANSGVL